MADYFPTISDTGDVTAQPGIAPAHNPTALGDEASSLLGALWRQNPTGSVLASEQLSERLFPTDTTPIDTDALMAALDRDQMWGNEEHFVSTRTVGEYNATRNGIERERRDREAMAEYSAFVTIPLGFAVGMADPINWIPMKKALDVARGAGSIARAAAGTGAVFGGFAALTEPVLQGTQILRSWEDGLTNVAAATVLGGVIGGGGAIIASPGFSRIATQFKQSVTDWFKGTDYNALLVTRAQERLGLIQDQINTAPAGVTRIDPATGVAVKQPSVKQIKERNEAFDELTASEERLALFNDNSMYKTGPVEWARTIFPRIMGSFHPGFLDRSDFLYNRTQSLEAKLGYQQMGEVVQMLNKNVFKGEPTAQAATTEMDRFMGGWAAFRDGMWGGSLTEAGKRQMGMGSSLFTQARKAGFTGTTDDYNREVAKAVVNGYNDPSGNAGVTAAAKLYKKTIVDPLRELMVKAGYPDPGESPRFAMGYMPRQYLIPNVRGVDGKGTRFKTVARAAYYDEAFQKADAEAKALGTVVSPQQLGTIRVKAKKLADQAYARITRDDPEVDGGLNFGDLAPGSAFEKRVVPIPDSVMIQEGWINVDISDVANLHIRRTLPGLLYGQRFKTATGNPDASLEHSLIPKVRAEYKKLVSVAEGKEADRLNRERDTVIEVLRNQRDGHFHGPRFNMEKDVSRRMENAVRMTMTYQAMRLMSNLVPSSLPDIAGLQFHHGLGSQMKVMLNGITRAGIFKDTNLEGIPKDQAIAELKTYGASIEWATNASLGAHMDLDMPYQHTSKFQDAMHNMSRVFSVTNYSVGYNDFMKGKAYRASMNRFLGAAERMSAVGWDGLPHWEKSFLSNHGIGESQLNRIAAAWRSQNDPMQDGFLRWAKMSDWSDQEAAVLLSNGIAKNRASTIIQPRVGDKSFLAETNPVLRMIWQFQNFISSHTLRILTLAEQRVMADGFYGRDALRVYGGLLQYASWGMVTALLQAKIRDLSFGVKDGEKSRTEKLMNAPGQLIAQGIERSGITGMFGNWNAMGERAGIPGMTNVWQSVMDDPNRSSQRPGQFERMSRAKRVVKAVGGPTIGQGVDVAETGIGILAGSKLTKDDLRTLSQIPIAQNNVFLRRYVLEPGNRYLAEDVLRIRYDR